MQQTTKVHYYRDGEYMGTVSDEQANHIIDAARKEGANIIHEFEDKKSTIVVYHKTGGPTTNVT